MLRWFFFLLVFLYNGFHLANAQSKWYFQASLGPNVSFNKTLGNENISEADFKVGNRAGIAFDFRLGRDITRQWGLYAGLRTGNSKIYNRVVTSGMSQTLSLSQTIRLSPAHLHMGTEYHSKYLDNHWRFSVGGDINYVINQYKNLAGTTTTYNSGGNAGIDDRFTSVQTRDFLDGNSWAVNLHAEAEYRFDTRHALVFGAYYNQGLRPLLTKRFEPLTFNGTDHNITITNRGSYLAFMLGYKRRVFNPKGSVRERVAPRREHDPFDETPGQELERGGRLLAVNFFAQPFPGAPRQTYYVNAKAGWFYTDRWAVGPDIAYSRSTGVFSFGGTEWYAGAFLRHYLPGRKNRGLDVYFDLSVQRRWFRSELPNNRTFRYASWDLGLTPGVNWRIARQFRLDASARILNQYVPGGGISFLSNLWPQIGCNYIIR